MTDPNDLPPLFGRPPGTEAMRWWLAVATGGLCDDARSRIRVEAKAHFDAAYSDLRAKGVKEFSAITQAVASLGDPYVAYRRFRRQNLTYGDQETLVRLAQPSKQDEVLAWVSVINLAFVCMMWRLHLDWDSFLPLLGLVLVSCGAVTTTVARYFRAPTIFYAYVPLVFGIAASVYMAVLGGIYPIPIFGACIVFASLVVLIQCTRLLLILKKHQRMIARSSSNAERLR